MRRIEIYLILLIIVLLPIVSYAVPGDYLILNDIDSYKFITQSVDPLFGKVIETKGYIIEENHPGIIVATGHFALDHVDITYSTDYESDITDLGVEVQVTQHAGADSDRWLLHEVEDGYRDGDDKDGRLGLLSGEGIKVREIDGNKIYYWGLGGGSYSWLSDNKVVEIKYVDLQRTKPEPIEVVKAYLAKHPSTIPDITIDSAHNEAWVKDEMERRLWLGDRWFTALQLEKAELGDVLREAVGHMGVFLDYREKYYGVSGDEEKAQLGTFLREQNGTEIKNRLDALKSWWAENKGNAINLP